MAWTLAAVNYNEKRRLGAPFCELRDGKLGSVYTMLTEMLERRGDWRRKPAARSRGGLMLPPSFHLLLGTAQGKGIPWEYHCCKSTGGPPLVNYYYGFETLTRKADLVSMLEMDGWLPYACQATSYGSSCPGHLPSIRIVGSLTSDSAAPFSRPSRRQSARTDRSTTYGSLSPRTVW